MQNFVSILIFISFNYLIIFSSNAEFILQRQKRAIVKDVHLKWKNFPIKYTLSPELSVLSTDTALDMIKKETCISFKRVSKLNGEGIEFITGDTYKTKLGKHLEKNKAHKIYISRESVLLFPPILILVLRALGVDYEHNRPDRDRFVKIFYNNLNRRYSQYTKKKSANDFETYGIGYDYNSRMQLPLDEWSKNGLETFAVKKTSYDFLIKHNYELTFNDAKLLNKHYCRMSCRGFEPISCLNYGYPNPKNCSVCKCPRFYEGDKCEKYKTSKFRFCGKTIFTAKEYPQKINFNSTFFCLYRIHAEIGKRIYIKFLSRHPNKIKGCTFERGLEIAYLSDKSVRGPLFCGKIKQNGLFSENNLVLISFHYPLDTFSPTIEYYQINGNCGIRKKSFLIK